MIHLVFSLWVAVIAIQTCQCRPSSSLENDKSGKFGYNYAVSHSPGASNVHLSFGRSKLDQKSYDNPERDGKNYQYEPNSPSKSYQPAHYEPSVSSGTGVGYSSPYDSDRKQTVGEHPSYSDDTHGSKIYEPVPESTAPNFHSGSPESHYSHHEVDQPSHFSDPTVASGPSYPAPIGGNYNDVPVQSSKPQYTDVISNPNYHPQQEPVPVAQHNGDIPPYAHNPHLAGPPTQQIPISQHDFSEPSYIPDANPVLQPVPVSQHGIDVPSYAHDPNLVGPPSQITPVSQHGVDVLPPQPPIPVSQHGIEVIPAPHSSLSQKTVGPPVSLSHPEEDPSGDFIQSPPVGAKYAIVPSGPPYTKDTFTAEIIHGPQTGEAHSVSGAPVYTAEKPTPISHSITLPYGPSAPQAHTENIPSLIHNDDAKILNPISHSTQLIIPASVNSVNSVGIEAISPPNAPFPHQDKIEDSAPVSHSAQLLIPPPAFPSNPTSIKTESPQLSSPVINDLPPLSHSSQIILPVPVPQIKTGGIESIPSGGVPESGYLSSQEKVDGFGPVSHSAQLLIPSSDSEKTAPIQSLHPPEHTAPNPLPVAPLSHTIRLPIPSDIYSAKTDGVKTFSEPASANFGDGHSNIPDFHPGPFPSHQVGTFSESGLNFLESSRQVPPISHSFALNVPQLTPGVLPVIPDQNSGENISPVVPDAPKENKIPPTSHSFKLILPQPYLLPDLHDLSAGSESGEFGESKDGQVPHGADSVTLAWPPTPTEQDVSAPQVQYSEPSPQTENFKSSDASLLAVETKKPRRKVRKLRKRS